MVNYPHQISRKIAQVRPKKSNRVDFANRGMSFESAINATNDYYLWSSVKMGSASCYFTSRRLRKPTFCLPKT